MSKITINTFSDGGCYSVKKAGSLVTGGLGVVIELDNDPLVLISATSSKATNNKMELMGAMITQSIGQYILGMMEYDRNDMISINTTSDSEYTIKGINEWLPNWKKRGWKTASKEPVKNCDYWKVFDRIVNSNQQIKNLRTTFKWVRGHNGHGQNELCDRLAEAYKLHTEDIEHMDPNILAELTNTIDAKFNGKTGNDYRDATLIHVNLDKIFSGKDSEFAMQYVDLCDKIAELID